MPLPGRSLIVAATRGLTVKPQRRLQRIRISRGDLPYCVFAGLALLAIGYGFLEDSALGLFASAPAIGGAYMTRHRVSRLAWGNRWHHGLREHWGRKRPNNPRLRHRAWHVWKVGRAAFCYWWQTENIDGTLAIELWNGRVRYAHFRNTPKACLRSPEDLARLYNLIIDGLNWTAEKQEEEGQFLFEYLNYLGRSGQLNVITGSRNRVLMLFMVPFMTGLSANKIFATLSLRYSDVRNGIVTYRLEAAMIPMEAAEQRKQFFRPLLAGEVKIRPGPVPGSFTVQRMLTPPAEVWLQAAPRPDEYALGIDLETGEQVTIKLGDFYHQLIMGATRGGKTTFMEAQILQDIQKPAPRDEKGADNSGTVAGIGLVDLKFGGPAFSRYIGLDPRIAVFHAWEDVREFIALLYAKCEERGAILTQRKWRKWRGAWIRVYFDEASRLEQHEKVFAPPPHLSGKEAREWLKEQHEEFQAQRRLMLQQLRFIVQEGAGLGIICCFGLQHVVSDSLARAIQANMEQIICCRVNEKGMAARFLGPTDALPRDPTQLERGHMIYRDPVKRCTRLVQGYWTDAIPETEEDAA